MGAMRAGGIGVVLATALVVTAPALARAADDFVVIVNPSVVGAQVRRSDLAAVFLRTATRWGGGKEAVPVDQSGTSAVRKAFSDSILGMPLTTALQYWQKQMFTSSPRRPPAVKGSDAEVVDFVENTEGAVGYVSRATALPPGVRVVAVID
jgi:ABC-type phosphate transport system substrate-binding protein